MLRDDHGWTSVDKAIDDGAKWISENFINKKGVFLKIHFTK